MKNVQIERRRQRAREERFEIKNLSQEPIYSKFQVHSGSDKVYTVTIRDLSAPGANGCTCPDFLVNQLGTCKHVEAVVLHLKQVEPGEYRRARLTPPPNAYVYLNYGETVSVEARRPVRPTPRLASLLNSHFDFQGRFRGDPVTHFREFRSDLLKLSPREQNSLKIAEDVEDCLEYERQLRKRRLEHSRYLSGVESGRYKFEPLREPLYPYQIRGALHLAFNRRAMLADEIGLGKTVQAIAAAVFLMDRGDIQNCLVVCPASLKRQWLREIERFTGLPAVIIEGNKRQQIYAAPRYRFYVVSYELTLRDQQELTALAPGLIVLDEAQRIKNWRTRTAQAVKNIPSKAAFVLTGAPIETDLEALYSIVQFLDQRKLGPLWRYYEQYFRFDGRGRHIGFRNLDELKQRLEDSYLRRTKESVQTELPDLIESFYGVELAELQRDAYQRARQQAIGLLELAACAQLDSEQRRELDDQIEIMRKAANAPKSQGAFSPKLEEARAVFEETVLLGGRKAVVFASDRTVTSAVCELLDELDISHIHFHGAIPHDQRAATVQAFTADETCRVFVATDLGSVGLNLQVADVVINLDQPLSANRRDQRLGRVYRLGRREPVNLIHVVAQDTLEETLLGLQSLDRKVLSRWAEADTTRGPMDLGMEVKGRSLRAALAELLTTAAINGPHLHSHVKANPEPQNTHKPEPQTSTDITEDSSAQNDSYTDAPALFQAFSNGSQKSDHEPQNKASERPSIVDLKLAAPRVSGGLFDQLETPTESQTESQTSDPTSLSAADFHCEIDPEPTVAAVTEAVNDSDLDRLIKRLCEVLPPELAQVIHGPAEQPVVITAYPRQVLVKLDAEFDGQRPDITIVQPFVTQSNDPQPQREARLQFEVAQSLLNSGFSLEAAHRLRRSLCLEWQIAVTEFSDAILRRLGSAKIEHELAAQLALLQLCCESESQPAVHVIQQFSQSIGAILGVASTNATP